MLLFNGFANTDHHKSYKRVNLLQFPKKPLRIFECDVEECKGKVYSLKHFSVIPYQEERLNNIGRAINLTPGVIIVDYSVSETFMIFWILQKLK